MKLNFYTKIRKSEFHFANLQDIKYQAASF